MRVSLVLLCLVLLWGDSLSEECVRELQVDVDFPGSDILQILSPDAHHCQLACTQHHHCLFFTFVRPEWTRDKRQFYCYLKRTDSGKPAKITSLSGVTSGYSVKTCEDRSPQTCLSTVYKNVDFTGADYTSLFTADYEDCQSTCTKDPDCQFFSFLNQDFPTSKYRNKCFLKHRRVFPSPPRVNSLNGVASGFSHKICTAGSTDGKNCQYKIQTDVDFPGNDFEQVPSPSPEYCHFLCTIHPRCTFYSYARRICYLKQVITVPLPPKVVAMQGVVSGFHQRGCQQSEGVEKTVSDSSTAT